MVVARLEIDLCGIKMRNPVMVASGTFGSGREYADFVRLEKLGALVTKSVTLEAKVGNATPRIAETPSGMLNSIGLQNLGVTQFIQEDLAFLSGFDVPVIVSVAGETVEEYGEVIDRLTGSKSVKAFELNISCPNTERGGVFFGCRTEATSEVVAEAKRVTDRPVIAKLTPNVTSISEIALAAQAAGADAVSLVNTFFGLSIDTDTFKPKLASGVGGLSGPAIRPLAVRAVSEVAAAVDIPVIGIGGIMTARDAVEFMLVGASAVQVGTATFVDPQASTDIIRDLGRYLDEKGYESVSEIVGKAAV